MENDGFVVGKGGRYGGIRSPSGRRIVPDDGGDGIEEEKSPPYADSMGTIMQYAIDQGCDVRDWFFF